VLLNAFEKITTFFFHDFALLDWAKARSCEVSSLKITLTDSSNHRRSRHNLRFSYSLRFPLSPAVLDSPRSPGLQAAHGCPNRR
jgi:hypothetical protein